MIIRINDVTAQFDETVSAIEGWYDRHTRLWVIQKINKDGFQVGDCEYVYGKKQATAAIKKLRSEYSI